MIEKFPLCRKPASVIPEHAFESVKVNSVLASSIVTVASLKYRYVFEIGKRHLKIDSLAEKIILSPWFACSAVRVFNHSSSCSTQTCLLMLKSTALDKLSKSMPIPETASASPTAAAAYSPECVMLPRTPFGQHGSLVSAFLGIGSASSLNFARA